MYRPAVILVSRRILSYESFLFFFFNDTATTDIYTLSLHDALPIFPTCTGGRARIHRSVARHRRGWAVCVSIRTQAQSEDRKSTRLNSSHVEISYAVFCLKKKKHTNNATTSRPSTYTTSPPSVSESS